MFSISSFCEYNGRHTTESLPSRPEDCPRLSAKHIPEEGDDDMAKDRNSAGPNKPEGKIRPQTGRQKAGASAAVSGPAARKYITELFVRLLGLWLIFNTITAFFSYLPQILRQGSATVSLNAAAYAGIVVAAMAVLVAMAALMIVHSEKVARFVWTGREERDLTAADPDAADFYRSIISGLGVYFAVSTLSALISDGLRLSLDPQAFFPDGLIDWYSVAPTLGRVALFVFGMVLFISPKAVVTVKGFILEIGRREENEADEETEELSES
jgi:hypothetical protein